MRKCWHVAFYLSGLTIQFLNGRHEFIRVHQSRSVLPLRLPKAREFGELSLEKCTRAPWTFSFKLARNGQMESELRWGFFFEGGGGGRKCSCSPNELWHKACKLHAFLVRYTTSRRNEINGILLPRRGFSRSDVTVPAVERGCSPKKMCISLQGNYWDRLGDFDSNRVRHIWLVWGWERAEFVESWTAGILYIKSEFEL